MPDRAHVLLHVLALALIAACRIPDVTFTRVSDAGDPGEDHPDGVAPTSPPPSCVDLATTCGAGGNDGCCNSPEVAGGAYHRSYDLAGDSGSGDQSYPATVSTFHLDKYEVTVGRFRAFVNAGMGTQGSPPMPDAGAHPDLPGSGWDATWNAKLAMNKDALVAAVNCNAVYSTWTDTPGPNEDRPMTCLTWYEAMAFCAWDRGYLPTEAEWNYAATGGDQQRAYPWSSPAGALPLDGSRASYGDGDAMCYGDGMPDCALTDLVVVGTKPAGDGRWGQSDLAGNVDEWMLDWSASYVSPCTDCAHLAVEATRVLRGGSFGSDATFLRTSHRNDYTPMSRYVILGARCARTAP